MKIKHFFALIAVLFILAGCGQAPEKTFNEKIADTINETETIGADYLGSWMRTGTYADDILIHQEPATLTFNNDSTYSSAAAACVTSGTHTPSDDTVTMVMQQSSCPGGVQPPYTVVYTYTIEDTEDGEEIMTIVTGNVKETYIRQ